MKKFKVETIEQIDGCTGKSWFYCFVGFNRFTAITTDTYSSRSNAKRAFIQLSNRLGIPRENYDFEEVKK